ncbi:MAG TPA: hypothetical protein VK750_04435 [Cytophagaceae bacterium]|nr:hypothetical protein [Cytophagaceae bacterium]
MSILFNGFYPLPDGGSFAIPSAIPYGTSQTVSFSVKNASSATADLILTKDINNHYATLGGNAAAYVTLDESTTSGDITAGSSTQFNVTLSGSTPPGNYTLTLSMVNNDSSHDPYTGTITFTISPPTGIVSARDLGITLSPVPSTDGRITINGNIVVNKIVVYGSNGVSEPFESTMSFHTRQKGVLMVQMYTDKGVVEEKILVQ